MFKNSEIEDNHLQSTLIPSCAESMWWWTIISNASKQYTSCRSASRKQSTAKFLLSMASYIFPLSKFTECSTCMIIVIYSVSCFKLFSLVAKFIRISMLKCMYFIFFLVWSNISKFWYNFIWYKSKLYIDHITKICCVCI